MAIIVDKEQKRNDIAMACKDLFIKNGIDAVTVSQIAKEAGVGKGTVYDYFENKEDIVFEIVNTLMLVHNEKKVQKLSNYNTVKEKVKEYFNFFSSKEDSDLRSLYLHFVSISLKNPSEKMIEFNNQITKYYFEWFVSILQEGIDKQELHEDSISLAKGLYVLGEGILIKNSLTNGSMNTKVEIDNYVDSLFNFIEIKNSFKE